MTTLVVCAPLVPPVDLLYWTTHGPLTSVGSSLLDPLLPHPLHLTIGSKRMTGDDEVVPHYSVTLRPNAQIWNMDCFA